MPNETVGGPGLVFLGPPGATPTIDVGGIAEDGINVALEKESRDIMQGNPKIAQFRFDQQHGVLVKFKSIEWDFENFQRALGSGVTTTVVGPPDFLNYGWGGDPCPTEFALRIQHAMCLSGHTMYINVWRVVSDSGFEIALGQDEHMFEFSFRGLVATQDWASAALSTNESLIQFSRQTAA